MLLYVLGILIILVGLAVSIGLHEIGHLVPAKLFGVKVTQYMVGFGKTLWSRKKGETEYGVKMIPLGGYVAMTGMYPPNKPGEVARASTTGFLNSVVQEGAPAKHDKHDAQGTHGTQAADLAATDQLAAAERDAESTDAANAPAPRGGIAGLVDDAREASAETIADGEDHRTFYRLAVWKKIIIMLGGPLMNLVLAFVFFGIVFVGIGIPQPSLKLDAVSECLIPAGSDATSCTPENDTAPAAAAGMLPGDRVLAVDGVAMADWTQFRDLVSASPNTQLSVEIERAGEVQTVTLTPAPTARAVTDDKGNTVKNADGTVKLETVGMVGATSANEFVSQPLSQVPAFVGENVKSVVGVVTRLPQRMVDTWQAAFGSEERDPNGPISVVGVGRIAGEVATADVSVTARAQTLIGLLGSLNVALFVFNLIPLMPLDGGHVAGALYEGIKRGFAKLRGKPDPGPVDTAKMVPVTFVVVILLGAMSALLIYADLVKPVSLFG